MIRRRRIALVGLAKNAQCRLRGNSMRLPEPYPGFDRWINKAVR